MRFKKTTFLILITVFFTLTLSSCGNGICPPDSGTCEENNSDISFSVSFPSIQRKIWVSDNETSRTVSFPHTADSLRCTVDGGSTSSCSEATSTWTWAVNDYNKEHTIDFLKGDTVKTYTFTPSQQFPNLSFVSCDVEISADEDFDTFETRITGSNTVFCFSDNVNITNTGSNTDIVVGFDNITLIARRGQTATFRTTRASGGSADQPVFSLDNQSGIRLVGLNIELVNGGASWGVRTNASSQDLIVDSCSLSNTAGLGSSYLLNFVGGGSTTSLKVQNSTLTAGTTETGIVSSFSAIVEADNLKITGGTRAVSVTVSATLTLKDSTIINSVTADTILSLFNGASLNMTNTNVQDGSGQGTITLNDPGSGTTALNINNCTFTRTTDNSGNTDQVIDLDGTSTMTVDGSNNLFCATNTSTVTFSAIFGGSTGTHTGAFSLGDQQNSGTINTCP